MDVYYNALDKYLVTLEVTYGCYDRSGEIISSAYEELQDAYQNLTPEERARIELPTQESY